MMDNSSAVGFGDFCVSRLDDLVLAFRKSGFGCVWGVDDFWFEIRRG